MRIAKILVGTDFSESARIALIQAMKIAHRTGANITLCHIAAPELELTPAAARVQYQQLLREQLDTVRAELQALGDPFPIPDSRTATEVFDAVPQSGLARAAKHLGADLIVLATHGRTGYRRILLGSVAERVVRLAETSVLVARPDDELSPGFTRILVPTDFAAAADKALDAAVELANSDTRIDVLHVWQRQHAGYFLDPLHTSRQRSEELADAIHARGEKLVERFRPAHPNIEFLAVCDSEVRGIQKRLDCERYDLVVMGSHGRRGLQRMVLGSVAESTVRYSRCSVLVVR